MDNLHRPHEKQVVAAPVDIHFKFLLIARDTLALFGGARLYESKTNARRDQSGTVRIAQPKYERQLAVSPIDNGASAEYDGLRSFLGSNQFGEYDADNERLNDRT